MSLDVSEKLGEAQDCSEWALPPPLGLFIAN
jgi:hypothetical protein